MPINESTTITDLFDSPEEFESVLSSAESNADSDWEINFVEQQRERFVKYGPTAYLSEKQATVLKRIAEGT